MNTEILGALISSLALLCSRIIGCINVSPKMGAASLPVVPYGGSNLPATLAVARAIKPTETVGSLAKALIDAKNTSDDRKVFIQRTGLNPARVLMMPATAVNADTIDTPVLLGTITRDDASKETSSHSLAAAAGKDADPIVVALVAALAAQKPKRSGPGLLNAVVDAVEALNDGAGANLVVVVDQTDEGNVKIYTGDGFADIAARVADVGQEAADAPASGPSFW